MKQVSLRLRDGHVDVVDVPSPTLTPDGVLIDVRASVLSVGTERSKVKAGRENMLGKARARPDQARQVLEKARRDGLRETAKAVRTRLDQPTALGYSAAGVILEVGSRVRGFAPGDHVACGGGDHAVHADVVLVPANLCVLLPEGVGFDAGAFATVASVAMHGVRQADARIGERVVVIGLGLVGQLTGQILRAAGCRVVGIDLAEPLVCKAREVGSIDVGYHRAALGGGRVPAPAAACDSVIVTAATQSSDPIELAARLLRDRGRVVIVGDVHVDVPRAPYYEREIEIRFSRSYGPGRYDREYEERGLDYPIGYVRWTEQRNMAAFLDLVAAGRIDVRGLICERVSIDDASDAYARLVSADESPLGVALQYRPTELAASLTPDDAATIRYGGTELFAPTDDRTVNVIGAGSFAQRVLIPNLEKAGFKLGAIASAKGLSAKAAADRFGFARAASPEEAVTDPGVGLVAIATRHASHASLAETALRSGKAVFVEKPPCLTSEELAVLRVARVESGQPLFVGFNRRHAPMAIATRNYVREGGEPMQLLYRVNAGPLAPTHWLNDPNDGGGRLLGEGCHFIDFACWMVGARPVSVVCVGSADTTNGRIAAESFVVGLRFADGSVATVFYHAGGANALAKEYIEAHSGGRSACVDDFRTLTTHDGRRRKTVLKGKQDKGHAAQCAAILASSRLRSDEDLDPLDSMATTLEADEALRGRS